MTTTAPTLKNLIDWTSRFRSGRVTVTPTGNGPLLVEGNLEMCSGIGRTFYRVTKVALCRCGNSGKPFCDGSHLRAGFEATP